MFFFAQKKEHSLNFAQNHIVNKPFDISITRTLSHTTLPIAIGSVWDNGYRYKFNSKETDNETGLQDYGFRIYNPSLGKFLSVDPLAPEYPWYTPYQFAGNIPIGNIDRDGLEPDGNPRNYKISEPHSLKYSNGKLLYITDANLVKYWVFEKSYSHIAGKKGGLTIGFIAKDYYWIPNGNYANAKPTDWVKYIDGTQPTDHQKMMYSISDGLAKATFNIAVAGVAVVSGGGILALEGAATKATVSTTVLLAVNGKVDIVDVAADACLAPGASATLGALIDVEATCLTKLPELKIAGTKNKSNNIGQKEFINSFAWGMVGSGAGNAMGTAFETIQNKTTSNILKETITSPAAVGSEGIEKVINDNANEKPAQ